MRPLFAIAPLALLLAFFGPSPSVTLPDFPQDILHWFTDTGLSNTSGPAASNR